MSRLLFVDDEPGSMASYRQHKLLVRLVDIIGRLATGKHYGSQKTNSVC